MYVEPDTSYGGLRWGLDLPEPLAPLAFILRMRTVPLRNLGSCISPDNSWMFLQGIETLPLRMERHCENALKVAQYLKAHPNVEWVRYPGLEDDSEYYKNMKYLNGKGGSLVVFEIKGGADAGKKFIDSLKLWSHVANVGDVSFLIGFDIKYTSISRCCNTDTFQMLSFFVDNNRPRVWPLTQPRRRIRS